MKRIKMAEHQNERDPMAGQTFGGIGGNPMARMPDPPPLPGEGGKRGQWIGSVISILILLAVITVIIIF